MTPARTITLAVFALVLLPAAAEAKERVLTLYSPAIQTLPYVHDTHYIDLRPNGNEAPARAGYITGVKEQSLVDSKDPDAKPLPNAKFMIHHFVYLAPGRVEDSPNSCWTGGGFITGRGEEHPEGTAFDRWTTPESRAKYGIVNRMPNGDAPAWKLIAMVMNHVKRPKKVYVRTRVHYTREERQPIYPTVVGDCAKAINGMAYDIPGGGAQGETATNTTSWTAPFNGRILLAASHQHGGGRYHTLSSDTCQRRIFKARTYYAPPDHIYNTIRPILHEPGPIGNGTFRSVEGVPIREGEQFTRTGVHDNSNLHVAAMAFWALFLVKDDSVTQDCAPLPDDITDVGRLNVGPRDCFANDNGGQIDRRHVFEHTAEGSNRRAARAEDHRLELVVHAVIIVVRSDPAWRLRMFIGARRSPLLAALAALIISLPLGAVRAHDYLAEVALGREPSVT